MAAIRRADILKGASPVAGKRKAKALAARVWTVRGLIKACKEKVLFTLAKSTRVLCIRHLDRVDMHLGLLAVREVEASDIARTHDARVR